MQQDDGGAKITKTLAKDNGKCALRTSAKSCAPGGKPPEPTKGNCNRKSNSKDSIDDKCGHSRKNKNNGNRGSKGKSNAHGAIQPEHEHDPTERRQQRRRPCCIHHRRENRRFAHPPGGRLHPFDNSDYRLRQRCAASPAIRSIVPLDKLATAATNLLPFLAHTVTSRLKRAGSYDEALPTICSGRQPRKPRLR